MLAAAYSQFETMSADDFKNVGSKATLKESSMRGQKVTKGEKPELTQKTVKYGNIDMILPAFQKGARRTFPKNSGQDFNKQLKSVSAFMLFAVVSGLSMAYFVTFKTYHAQLQKMDSLKALLNNPNARVAAGQTGKDLMAKIEAHKAKSQAPKKILQSSQADETVELLKTLIDAKKTEKSMSSDYEAPLIN